MRSWNCAVLELQRDAAPGETRGLEPPRDALHRRHSTGWRSSKAARSRVEGGLGRDALRLALRAHRPVRPRRARARASAPRSRPTTPAEIAAGARRRWRDRCAMPARARRACAAAADAGDDADRPLGEERRGLGAPDDREAARLVEIGGDLGQELVVRKPDRDRDAELLLDPLGEADQGDGRARAGGRGRCRKGRGRPRRSRPARPAGSARASAARTSRPTCAYCSMFGLDRPPRADRP